MGIHAVLRRDADAVALRDAPRHHIFLRSLPHTRHRSHRRAAIRCRTVHTERSLLRVAAG